MTTRALAAAAAVLVVSAGLAARPQDPQTPQTRFRSTASAVMVDVSVRDRTRRVVTGLKPEHFTILDNGVPQRVADVSYGKLPIDVTVALDVSQSVSGTLLRQLQQAVLQMMRDLRKDDRLKLVLFNAVITRIVDYTSDEKAVERAIRDTTAGGGTAFLDAVSVTLVSKAPADRRQLVMFFTDGSDSSSTTSPDVVTAVAQRTRATLAFVMPSALRPIFSSSSVTMPGQNVSVTVMNQAKQPGHAQASVINTLATETGGTIIGVGQGSLANTFRTVLNDFRSAYVLYYTPSGVDRGGYHTIEVKVDRDGATVQARRGYFGS